MRAASAARQGVSTAGSMFTGSVGTDGAGYDPFGTGESVRDVGGCVRTLALLLSVGRPTPPPGGTGGSAP